MPAKEHAEGHALGGRVPHHGLFGRQGPETRHEVLPPDDASFALFEAPVFRGTSFSQRPHQHVGVGFGGRPLWHRLNPKFLPSGGGPGSLAEARAPLFHVKVEMVLVGVIGLRPEHSAEFMTGFIVHMLYELGLRVRGRLRSDRGR